MVSQFPLDYMHLVCLGVTRRLILLWMMGPLRVRIGSNMVRQISESLTSLAAYVPREFARKPSSLPEVKRWKATEFRQFLLYTEPVVLCHKLSDAMYKNFLFVFYWHFYFSQPFVVNTVNLLKISWYLSFNTSLKYMVQKCWFIMSIIWSTLQKMQEGMGH